MSGAAPCACKRTHHQHDHDCPLYAPDPPLIGEHGPEPYTPAHAATIVPHPDSLLGVPPVLCPYRGISCPQHVHARGPDCPTV